MREAALSPEARKILRTSWLRRLRAAQLAPTAARFTPMPARTRYSTRGQLRPSYYTKRHTPSRQRDLAEARA